MDEEKDKELRSTLNALKLQHRQLDEEIRKLIASAEKDQLKISRMKKQKLALKDEIMQLEDRLMPDIIA